MAEEAGFWGAVRRFQDKPWMAETLANDPVLRLPWIGYRIFKLLLAFSVLLLAALFFYAWVTYPNADAILKSAEFPQGTTFPQKLESLDAERQAWTTNIKDLGTIFLVTPVFSLVSAVVGYIFGVSRQTMEPGGAAAGGAGIPKDGEVQEDPAAAEVGGQTPGEGGVGEAPDAERVGEVPDAEGGGPDPAPGHEQK